jgi:hypothetical protein
VDHIQQPTYIGARGFTGAALAWMLHPSFVHSKPSDVLDTGFTAYWIHRIPYATGSECLSRGMTPHSSGQKVRMPPFLLV